jgi:hypothetical protein
LSLLWDKGISLETCENGKRGDAICGFKVASTLLSGGRAPLSCDGSPTCKEMTNSTSRKCVLSHMQVDDGRESGSESSYLVDPASSHMLVSKIKPCMSKYKQVCTVKLRMAH